MYSLLLADIDPVTKWMFICMAILTILLAIVRPFSRKKDPLARPPAFGSLAQQRSVERQMQNVLVDLSEMSRQITAQLDTRATKLEALIKEADQKIAALNAAAAKSGAPASFAPQPGESSAPVFETVPPDTRHVEVYNLADQGRTPGEIAQQLNRPSGEVELILALRR
jgi:hypothetical protein